MNNDIFSELNLESAPDTQLNSFPTIGDAQLDEILSDAKALTMDMPDLTSTATATLPQRRRDRANEREQKLRRNARRFYRGYFITIAVVLCALLILMIPLRNWLVRFESTQPDHKSQQVYEALFAQPDWGKIYDQANTENSDTSERDAYVSYMQEKVNAAENKQLSFYETSAGLSKDHKYIVELDGEKIAIFSLSGSVNEKSNQTEWEMSNLELVMARNHSIIIQRLPRCVVRVNGKEIGDECIIRTISTWAEGYLPENVFGFRMEELCVESLAANPTVEVLDYNGNAMTTVFNPETNTYELDLSDASKMTDAEQDIILGAAKANALFAIRAIGTGDLREYFDPNTQIYQDICSTPTFIQSFESYNFDESVTAISDFYRYNDDIFSAKVTLQLNVTRKNGTVKNLDMNTSYIFTKNAAGNFMVTNITNVDLQEREELVRVQYDCNGTIIHTTFSDVTTKSFDLPQPDVQPGQEFLGWATRSVAEDGQITMNIIFAPGETAQVPDGFVWEPMTLYAVFQAEEAPENG